jgi:hypothetical protein
VPSRARQSADRRLEKSCEIAASPDIGREAQLTRLQLAKVGHWFLANCNQFVVPSFES